MLLLLLFRFVASENILLLVISLKSDFTLVNSLQKSLAGLVASKTGCKRSTCHTTERPTGARWPTDVLIILCCYIIIIIIIRTDISVIRQILQGLGQGVGPGDR